MSAREEILSKVRANLPGGDHPLPDLPHFPVDHDGDRTSYFLKSLDEMGGKHFTGTVGELLAQRFSDAQVVASLVPEIDGTRDIGAAGDPGELADVDVAIVRAAFAIAETGTVALPDENLGVNAVAYLAQHLIVLVDPDDIEMGLQDAYRRSDMAAHRYLAFHSGPSATADIEGVLIHGAQGVRSLTVVFASDKGPVQAP